MTEHPILFSGEMVRAILTGHKTETRRVIRCDRLGVEYIGGRGGDQNDARNWGYEDPDDGYWCILARGFSRASHPGCYSLPCPYGGPGDLLWVREAHKIDAEDGDLMSCPHCDGVGRIPERREDIYCDPEHECDFCHGTGRPLVRVRYRATEDHGDWPESGPWRPSIHMPRWASRITLRVEIVRVERLQTITEEGADAEGCHLKGAFGESRRWCYENLWDRINAARGYPWADDPWVWVVAFSRVTP